MAKPTTATNENLLKAELFACRDLIFERVKEIMLKRSDLMDQGKISFNQTVVISNDETRLLTLANQASNLIIHQVLTDIQKPGQILKKVSQELEDTIKRLKGFNDCIGILSIFIKIFGKIVTAIASGPGAIAQIGALIDDFKILDQSLL
jgi:hypothetical protein